MKIYNFMLKKICRLETTEYDKRLKDNGGVNIRKREGYTKNHDLQK